MPSDPVDLSNCDREPIHIPGAIQPYGCLIACDATAATVLRHSANAGEMLGCPGELNGRPLVELIGPQAVHDLRNALLIATRGRSAMLLGHPIQSGRRFDVAVHQVADGAILEFEPAGPPAEPLHRARELIGRISEIDDLDQFISRSARIAHALLGYDRVMIYRFEADGAGKVVSETRRPDLESFLGQYFPASDIPAQARELYLRNTLRIISDVDAPRVPILPEIDAEGEPLDLSLAHLRSVSPIHCEYLRNMGVAASMSISVIVEGRLWGLIACHHYAPRVLTMSERIASELFGQFFSLHLHALKQKRSLRDAREARLRLDRFLRLASEGLEVETVLRESLPDFRGLLQCDGAGLWLGGRWSAVGVTPPPEAIPHLAVMVGRKAAGAVWATHGLSRHFPPALGYHGEASGLLAVPLSQTPRDWLFFFRKEIIQTLSWAGNPEKIYQSGTLGDRLTPRKSFALWKQTVERQSQPWTQSDIDIAEATRAATVEVVLRHNEAMAEDRNRAEFRQRMLNEELNHRVKNILAVIRSLVGHPVQQGRSLEEHVDSLRGRIQALAFAHDQVARGGDGGRLADLVGAELGPYRGQGGVLVRGPEVWLDSRSFSVMALVLHELATNAAKYGALSVEGGRLDLIWRDVGGDVEIEWRERDGPPVTRPGRTGFGTALIDRSIPYDLGGESAVQFEPEGMTARFRLPRKHVTITPEALPDRGPAPMVAPPVSDRLPDGLQVLLLEDQLLIAMDAEAMLGDAGAAVTTTSTLAEVRAWLRETSPDVAVLDVNIGQDTSLPVAEELARRGVPFVFATGYGDDGLVRGFDTPVVRKPYDRASLVAAIHRAIGPRAGAG